MLIEPLQRPRRVAVTWKNWVFDSDHLAIVRDHRQPLEVVTDAQLVGHPHAAVQLDRVLTHEASRLAHLHLEGRNRLPQIGRAHV